MLHKPKYLQKDDFIDYLYKEIASDSSVRPTLSMIQFTDLHLDLEYMPGSSKTCKNVLCCRAEDGIPDDPSDAAGPYGALALCDVPANVLFKMGDKINELAPDVLFWTGDVVPHD
jgi:sphingomyelin phosphodiesterase